MLALELFEMPLSFLFALLLSQTRTARMAKTIPAKKAIRIKVAASSPASHVGRAS